MSRKQLKIYSNRDFKEASRLDRIYMWMIEPERFDALLSDEEERHARKLEQAYHGVFEMLQQSAAVKWIQNNIQGAQSPYLANRVLSEMQEIYGRFISKNKQVKQAIVVEKIYFQADRLIKISEELEEDGQLEAAANVAERAAMLLEKAAKLEGLDKVQTGLRPDDFKIPEIIISSDPKVLQIGKDEEE